MQNRILVSWADQDGVVSVGSGSIAYNVSTSTRTNGYMSYGGPASNGDTIFYTRYFLKGGLYKVRWITEKDSNSGICDIGYDSSTNNIFSHIDLYSASATYNNVYETIIEIPRGYHNINIKVNGKNASSSAYQPRNQLLEFDLIQEYPVYQDDKPAQINQGSMVLLGKHKALVAESTFTFNFADTDLLNKYSKIIVEVRGGTTASLVLQCIINGVSSSVYFQDGYSSISATLSNVHINSGSVLQLLPSTIANGNISGTLEIYVDQSSLMRGKCDFEGENNGSQKTGWLCNSNQGNILKTLQFSTSTSTWLVGTEFIIYGVKKQ